MTERERFVIDGDLWQYMIEFVAEQHSIDQTYLNEFMESVKKLQEDNEELSERNDNLERTLTKEVRKRDLEIESFKAEEVK